MSKTKVRSYYNYNPNEIKNDVDAVRYKNFNTAIRQVKLKSKELFLTI